MSHSHMFKLIFLIALIEQYFICDTNALQQNRTFHHVRRSSMDDSLFKNQKPPFYRSFQPVSIKYRKSYPREDRTDYDITSYDSEYGGVVSNFTSSIYDDNPPLYPNPETLSRSNQAVSKSMDSGMESEVELPDDSLADADLKEHNIIDSVTYLYGFNNCHSVRNEWKILILISSGLALLLLAGTLAVLLASARAADFRRSSELYPITVNLCCCLAACTLIYIQAVMGVSSPSACSRVALLLHYAHVCCATWIAAAAGAGAAGARGADALLPLKYNYLLAYGVPAVVVMFNYALSMEQYEIKHYCWMSVEKGMVLGCMLPATLLILATTGAAIAGLRGVHRRRAERRAARIQELLHQHRQHRTGSGDACSPGSSRRDTDTSDKDYNMSEDDCQYVNLGNSNGELDLDCENEPPYIKALQERGLLNVLYSMDDLSLRWGGGAGGAGDAGDAEGAEGDDLKAYLNLCLVLEPFFAINWVMGVVAIENAGHWSTPAIYLILVVTMYVYLTATLCTTLPIVRSKPAAPCCEEVRSEAAVPRTRTTDSIPLLDPAYSIQQPAVTPAPADTISTISI